jgi:serine protease AprX
MKNLLRIAVLVLTASFAFAQQSKIAPDLAGFSSNKNVNVIIQFKHAPTAAEHQKVHNLGGSLQAPLNLVKGAMYTVPGSALATLAKDGEVVHISPDRKLSGKLDLTAAAVNAAAAWQSKYDGTGIGVAVIDSGITPVDDLTTGGVSRVVYSQDFVGTGTDDFYGHGTHIAGIIAGNATDSTCPTCTRTLKGMAPNANLINLRVLDENGVATDSTVIAGIEQAVALASTYNIRVINLSVGRGIYESYTQDPLCQAVEAAWKAGIVVVVAAGNDGRDDSVGNNGYGTVNAPGNDPYVITVGAMKTQGTPTRTDDLIASYSSKGPTLGDNVVKPDLVAPGNQLVSLLASPTDTLPTNYPTDLVPNTYYNSAGDGSNSNDYYMLNGTSMATGVVSGAVALLLQAQPSLTPDQVKATLMLTAYKTFPQMSQATEPTTGTVYTDYYDMFTVGAGYLDIQAALANTSLATGNALSPTATYESTTGNASLVIASGSIWGTGTIWGTGSVWGTSVVSSNGTIWGSSSIWGTGTIWGTGSIWGTGTIWGSSSIWGSGTIFGQSADQATSVIAIGEK